MQSVAVVLAALLITLSDGRLSRLEASLVNPIQTKVVPAFKEWRYIPSSPMKRDRMCLINAGLSQGCDLSDILMAKQQASKFMSFAGPGRRR